MNASYVRWFFEVSNQEYSGNDRELRARARGAS